MIIAQVFFFFPSFCCAHKRKDLQVQEEHSSIVLSLLKWVLCSLLSQCSIPVANGVRARWKGGVPPHGDPTQTSAWQRRGLLAETKHRPALSDTFTNDYSAWFGIAAVRCLWETRCEVGNIFLSGCAWSRSRCFTSASLHPVNLALPPTSINLHPVHPALSTDCREIRMELLWPHLHVCQGTFESWNHQTCVVKSLNLDFSSTSVLIGNLVKSKKICNFTVFSSICDLRFHLEFGHMILIILIVLLKS